ncbi:hypothetical protein GBAR_LOCUS30677 [Geodia barretti]|uniref:Uncharacterized protein n=1 Tax=Geodia barretti TaxID=519541 RepID=A0AA35U0D6_GEOBA|nr:hypothetical protein GBAR_LOCUS30677 [Geodia barretti]
MMLVRASLVFCRCILFALLMIGNHGQPTLEPPTGYFCPNVNITYTCHDSQVTEMTWFAEPYFSGNQGIRYAAVSINQTKNIGDSFYTQATSFSVDIETEKFISVTTILTVITRGIENGTNITCLTYRGGYPLVSSSILYFADLPRWKNTSVIICRENNIAVLELEDMYDGGGVPIDHYIIQVDSGTRLETPGPTYSFDIMYNTTLPVNISAHNCAGYSDLFLLEIQYNQDSVEDSTPSMTPRPFTRGDSTVLVIVVPVLAAGALLVITISVVLIVLLKRTCSTNKNGQQEKCDVVENSAYGVHVQGSTLEPDYNMENNPLYEMRVLSNEGHSHKTQTPVPVPVYETVDTVAL